MSGRKTRQDQAPPHLGQLMGSTREPTNLVTSYYTSTPNKDRYKATATGEGEALSDLYPAIDAIGDEHHEPVKYRALRLTLDPSVREGCVTRPRTG